jgi:hypothetical protein
MLAQVINQEYDRQFNGGSVARNHQNHQNDEINNPESKMNLAYYQKCKLLVEAVNSLLLRVEEKQLLKELRARGGWFAELTQKKIDTMCQSYFWLKNNEDLNLASITHEALLKLLKLKDRIKSQVVELFQQQAEGILTTKLLKKLQNIATVGTSQLGAIAKVAVGMDGRQGAIVCKHLAKVVETIDKQNEETQEILLSIASDLEESVNVDDTESVQSFTEKLMAAEEMLANQIEVEVVREAIKNKSVEPGGKALQSLQKFNVLLTKTKRVGEDLLQSSSKLTGNIKSEIETRLATLGHVQLSLDFT